jgi:hypothetical protein
MHINQTKSICCFLSLLMALIIGSCSKDTNNISPVQDVIVREQLNLNSIEAQPLKFRDGATVSIKGGIKGIIIYRRSEGNFLAFERKSPYKLEDSCGIVSVHSSNLYMIDSCHNCTFDWEGKPTGGPCRDIMKQYQVQYSNNFTILITNQ